MEILMKTLKTEKELAREARNELIISKFSEMRENYPTASLSRIFNNLADDPEITSNGHKLTSQSIRNICKGAGIC